MANNEQFQASVVAGIETPGSEQAAKIFSELLRLTDGLEGSAKKAGQSLVDAFTAGKKPEELATQIRILQRELRFLATVGNGAELFKNDQVQKVNAIQTAINNAAKAYDSMRQSEALSRYELGLDSKTVTEAARNMATLEKNLKAVDLALQNNAGNQALEQKKQLLSDNKALLEVVIKDLKQQAEQERLNEQLAKQNWAAAQQRFAEVQRIAKQRKEQEGSASEIRTTSNTQFNYSQLGRDTAERQARLRLANAQAASAPGQEDIALQRIRDTNSRNYLSQVYSDAGLSQSSISATLRDGPKVRQLVADIKNIESQLVAERERGNVDLQRELTLLNQIRTKSQQVESSRYDQNLNDPARRQARLDAQSRSMLNRAGGEGGAALLAVQASVMANGSILNGAVGGIKSAISSSIELEAALHNVQAVTGTTNTEMGALATTIQNVAAQSKFSSQEVAAAALTLGQAGLSAKQVGEALGPVVMLAAAAGTSISQAVDLVTSVVGVFDKNTSDVADIANKVTQAANSSKLSVEKMATGLQYAGNIAANSGVSFEELTAAMAAMSNAGIKSGSTIGTGLRMFLNEAQKPSKEFVASLQRIGLSIADIDLKSNGLIGVAQKLREAGFTASDAIKSFDVRGAAAFNALIANPEELERQYRLLMDTQAGVRANEVQMDSLKAQSQRLTTSLENLAAAGFEPVGKLLTTTTGGFATMIQEVSRHNVVVGAAGIALAGLASSGAAAYLTSMAGGALRLATGAGEASLAVTTLQNASKVGSVGQLALSLGMISPVATVAAESTNRLAIATNTLKTSFLGLSITSGIGIAIGLLTAGYYAYDYIAGKTARDIDELKASTNSAKGAFEEKDAVVKSLTQKIEELNYKQSALRGNTDALKTESIALTSEFGKVGYQADVNNLSFDTMISKLRSLKNEMAEIRKQSLETALANNRALLQKQVEKAQSDVKGFSGTSLLDRNYAGDLANVMGTSDFQKLSASSQQKVRAAAGQLKTGDIASMNDVPGATLILQKLMADMQSAGRAGTGSYDRLDTLVSKLLDVGRSITEANSTRSDIAAQEGTMKRTADYDAYNKSGRFGVAKNGQRLTFEDSLPRTGNLGDIARQDQGLSKDADPIAIYNAMKVEQSTRAKQFNDALKKLKDDADSGAISADTKAAMDQMVKARAEKDRNDLLAMAAATEDEAGLAHDRTLRQLQAKLNNAKKVKNTGLEKDINNQIAELEVAFKNRAEVSDVKATRTREAIEAQRDEVNAGFDADKDHRDAATDYSNQKRLLESQMKNARSKKDKDKQIDITKSLAALEISFKNRDEADADRAAENVRQINEIRDQNIQNIKDGKVAGSKRNIMPRISERSLRMEAQAADAEADETKNSVKTASSLDQLDGIIDKAIASKIEAKYKRIEALKMKQDNEAKDPSFDKELGPKVQELEMKSLVSEENSKIDSFSTSFVGLLEAAMNRLDTVTKKINEQKRQIAQDKWEGEDRVFDAQQALRELDLQIATGKKTRGDTKSSVTYGSTYPGSDSVKFTPSGATVNAAMKDVGSVRTSSDIYQDMHAQITGVSSAIRGTLSQRRNQLVVESTKVELEENEKLLEEYGDDTTGLIGNLTKAYKTAGDKVKELSAKVATETDEAKKVALTAELEVATKQQGESFRDLRQAKGEQKQLRTSNFDIQKRQAENTEAIPKDLNVDNLLDKLDQVWDKYQQTVGQMDVVKTIGDGLSSVLGNTTGQLGNALAAVATGTKSIKEAFKDMAASVIKAMIDILAQAVAMQAVKGLLGLIGSGLGVGSAGSSVGLVSADSLPALSMPDIPMMSSIGAATGGLIVPGGIQRKPRYMAAGGTVTGGVPGRDSVPTMLMPGEFVMNTKAVDSVGTDYLHSLNQASNSVVSSSAPVASTQQTQQQQQGVVNVWVVTPDQKPSSMGPKDILAVVSDDISRGGSTKKLIKQVINGQV